MPQPYTYGQITKGVDIDTPTITIHGVTEDNYLDLCKVNGIQPIVNAAGEIIGWQYTQSESELTDEGYIERPVQDEATLCEQLPVCGRVCGDKGAGPKHDLETIAVKPVAHSLRIGEAARIEHPCAVVKLPCVVNHHHAGRESVVFDGLGVGENVLLVLIVLQLDPGVVLRRFNQCEIGQLAGRRKPLVTAPEIHSPEIFRGMAGLEFGLGGFRTDHAARNLE